MDKKGYVLIVVMTFIMVLALSAASIFFLVGSESVQTRRLISMTKAYYTAEAGAESMYLFIAANPGPDAAYHQINDVLGAHSYSATTDNIYSHPDHPGDNAWGLIEVNSNSTVGGVTRNVVAEYELQNVAWGNSSLLTLSDTLNLQGHQKTIRILWFDITITAGIDIEGPVVSNGAIVKNEPQDAISITGQEIEDLDLPSPDFMPGFDANRDDAELDAALDADGDGDIEYGDLPIDPETGEPYPAQVAVFNADDVNDDNVIDEKDGFIDYYTKDLNYFGGGDLGLDPDAGGTNYYSGDQTFGPGGSFESVPADTNIVFVDGNVDIVFNPASWDGGERDITVVSTGDITIVEPCNGDDDRLTLVSYGDVSTGGINIEFIDIIDSNMNVYAHGNFYAYYGGDTEGSIISKDEVDVDTKEASLFYAREIGKSDNILTDPPVGIPPMSKDDHGEEFIQGVCQIPLSFTVLPKPYSWKSHQE